MKGYIVYQLLACTLFLGYIAWQVSEMVPMIERLNGAMVNVERDVMFIEEYSRLIYKQGD